MPLQTIIDSGGHVVARIISNGDRQTLLDGKTSKVIGHYVGKTTLTSGGTPIGAGNQLLRLVNDKNRR